MTVAHASPREQRVIIGGDGKVYFVVPNPRPQIALRRVRSVPDDDGVLEHWEYHREGGLVGEVACGLELPADGSERRTREFRLDDLLCTNGCWSQHELDIGRTAALSRRSNRIKAIDTPFPPVKPIMPRKKEEP